MVISNEMLSGKRTILGYPLQIEYVDICVLSLELRGSGAYLHIMKQISGILSSSSSWARVLGWSLLDFFSRDFSKEKKN